MYNFSKKNIEFRKLTSLLLLFFLLNAALPGCDSAEREQELSDHQVSNGDVVSEIHAFMNVNVIPMTSEEVLENQTVVTENGIIRAIGKWDEVEIPEGAVEIDGSGKYLMPGLAEMHGHIPGDSNSQYAEDVLFLYISNGVTFVRNMAGHPSHLELRERIERNELTGPTILAATPWLNTDIVPSVENAEEVVQRFKEEGYDHMKMGGVPRDIYIAIAEASRETDLPFAGHIPLEVGLVTAIEEGQTSVDHYDRYVEFLVADDAGWDGENPGFFGSAVIGIIDEEKLSKAVEMTVEAGTWNVPTLSLVEHLASPEPAEEMGDWPEMRYMPNDVVEGWIRSKNNFKTREDFQPEATDKLVEIRQRLTRELFHNGAPIVLGSDAPQFFNVPGFSIHHEMQMMVNAGLTPYEVLLTGTVNAAEYAGTPEEFGTVQENRRADLILLEANPLTDISNVKKRAGVMVRGVWWPESEIQSELDAIADRVN